MGKSKDNAGIPKGMKCYRKINGGSLRFPNRIVKSGQKFWAMADELPTMFADQIEETSPDAKAVVIAPKDNVPVKAEKNEPAVDPSFRLEKAEDENHEVIKRGKNPLWNVINQAGDVMNEEPLTKGKAKAHIEMLNS